ncbi:MAG TPA: sulfite exporter TauE/SafE family protein [Bacteroidales bacterium]|nr:sulfite exporter TauE/SafE family protein [Bacteroidales bacterium]
MEIIIIAIAAFATSLLTFFSGFGLGTLLTPVFAFFFPIDISIALTGIVHLITNFTKAFLTGRYANRKIILWFGIPAILASFLGAWVLLKLGNLPPLFEYRTGDKLHEVTPVKLVIAILLLIFTIADFVPLFKKLNLNPKMLPVGGFLSGFFGGLSGLQGAIRGAFLVRADLSAEAYIATGAIIACFVDATRLFVYSSRFINSGLAENLTLVLAAMLSAVSGAILGKFLIKKITLEFIRKLVAVMLIIISIALAAGLI